MDLRRWFFIFAVSFPAILFSERYKIEGVDYELEKTRQYAVEQAVKIDTKRVFESSEEFVSYIEDLKQKFSNERVFDSSDVSWSEENQNENPQNEGDESSEVEESEESGEEKEEITLVRLRIVAKDSKHLLIVPYPKFGSSDGFNFKIKMKDMNFLGTMSPLTADIDFSVEPDDDDDDKDNFVFGINFDYDYPFALGPFDSSWNNNFGISWTIGEEVPEYAFSTGFTFSLPFDNFSLVFDIAQSLTRNTEYDEYGDTIYATSDASFSIPVTVARIDNWADVTWTPSVGISVNYDTDGISRENDDLSSPTLTFGHALSTGRYDWIGNFREGIELSMGQSVGYNFQRENYIPRVEAQISAFKAFKYAGIASRLYTFAMMNSNENIGSMLRGIRKNQKYADINKKALSTNAAIVFSLDVPIHIVSTDWEGWICSIFGEESWMAHHFSWMRLFDFELQLSPFGDLALTHNEATGKSFAIKDGWYAGGIEVLVYPKKWRSLVVRGSLGIDAGRKIVNKVVSKLFDDSWRHLGSAYEIYIGVGLQY